MTRNVVARWLTGLVGIFAAALLTSSANAQQLKIGILLPGSTADNGYNADGGRAAQRLNHNSTPMRRRRKTSRSQIRPISTGSMLRRDITLS